MKIMWFCIPAFGHTNPTIELVRELTGRGHEVRYYSFEMFRAKIEGAGAEFIPCDQYLADLSVAQEKRLRKVSNTEMTLQAIGTAISMDQMLSKDVVSFSPDLIVSDSVCFWGKLTAEKHGVPFVCSTTTFAFNRYSSKYLKYSISELADIVFGMGKIRRALKQLNALGYHTKSALNMVQNKNDTNTIVYASEGFQPCSETFDASHFCFMGPSVKDVPLNHTANDKPLIYISLGTVINDHPEFYSNCMIAMKDENVQLLISCGTALDPAQFADIPGNAEIRQQVDQMEVLSRASLFITHCGMNSASEGLYMGVPEVLFPLTGEQQAVARRVREVGAGIDLDVKTARSPQDLNRFLVNALKNKELRKGAEAMREEFRSSAGVKGGADFIERCAAK